MLAQREQNTVNLITQACSSAVSMKMEKVVKTEVKQAVLPGNVSGVDKIFSCLPAQHLLPGKATIKEKTQWTKHAPEGCVHRAAVQGVDPNNLDSYKTVRFEDPE